MPATRRPERPRFAARRSAAAPSRPADVALACAHCGLPAQSPPDDAAGHRFCCAGCRTAFRILHEHGLERYYDLNERRAERVEPTSRTYEEFDHPTFSRLYVTGTPEGLARVELYLDGVHCGSCVWLVERVPMVLPGVARVELEIGRSLARVTWDAATVPLSRVARTLDLLGYAPHPFRGARRDELRRAEDRVMLARIGIAGAIAVNVMLAALALYSGQLGAMERDFEQFFRWVSFALVTPAMVWPARVFFIGALSAFRTRRLHMDVPIALGLAAGYVQGSLNTVIASGPIYFDGLATLIFALLVGRYLQQRGQRAAADGAELLYSMTPATARVVDEAGRASEIPAEAVLPGMQMDVRAGETFAADGVVIAGESRVEMSLLTGESAPAAVTCGSPVYSGTLNVAAPLRVLAQHTGEASRVGRIMRQVEESAARRAPIVESANRMAGWFVLAVLLVAAATFAAWRLIDPARAVDNAVALLIVTCPCALALSTPLAVSVAIGRAARGGVFVKGGDALERLADPGLLLLDKTGTITEGRMALVEWNGPEWVKPLVLALEKGSSHPIAAAFRSAWPGVEAPAPGTCEHVAGGGIAGRVDTHEVVLGSPRFVASRAGIPVTSHPTDQNGGATPVVVAVDGAIVADARIGDPVRSDSRDAVQQLNERGWRVGVLSGDAPDVVAYVAERVGVSADRAEGGASPEGKLHRVERELEAKGPGAVVMVGDGINDAAAIAAASVGVGVHGGAEVCLAVADVYLARDGLMPLVRLIDGARRTMFVIRRNIAFSIVYNVIGGALAVTGQLNPLVAAILMPASSLTVLVSSWRARTFDDAREAREVAA